MSIFGLFDYPKEIKQLQSQIPKADRDEFMSHYKKLSSKNKDSFKQALRNTDVEAASAILNEDLTKYNISLQKPAAKIKKEHGRHHAHVTDTKNTTQAAKDSFDSKMVNGGKVVPTIGPAGAARLYAAAASSSNSSVEKNQPQVDGQTKLLRIDSSGIFSLPDETTTVDDVKTVLLNGKALTEDQYAITENGNLDIFESDLNSVVTVVF